MDSDFRYLPAYARYLYSEKRNDFALFGKNKVYDIQHAQNGSKKDARKRIDATFDSDKMLLALAENRIEHAMHLYLEEVKHFTAAENNSLAKFNYATKSTFIHFLSAYSSKAEEIIAITDELNRFFFMTESEVAMSEYKISPDSDFAGDACWNDELYAVIGVDRHFNIVLWNERSERKFQRKEKEVINKDLFSVIDEKNRSSLQQHFDKAFSGKSTFQEKERFYFPEEGLVQLRFLPLKDEAGLITSVTVLILDITSLVSAEAELKRLNTSFLEAEKIAGTAHFLWNLHSLELTYSETLYHLLGCEVNEFPAGLENFNRYVHPEDREKLLRNRERLLAQQQVEPFTFRVFKKDGSLRFFNVHPRLLEVGKNEKVAVGIIQDITENYALEKELSEQNKKLASRSDFVQLLLDSSIDMTAALDVGLKIIEWNKRCEEKLHLKREDVLGKNIEVVFPMVSNTAFIKSVHKALKGKTVRSRYPSGIIGVRRYLEIYYTPIITKNKTVSGVLIIVHDLTEISEKNRELNRLLKTLEEKNVHIRENEDRYHRLIEDIEDYAIFGLNPNGVIVSWNKGAEKIKGYSANEVIGHHFSMFFTESDLKKNMPHRLLQMAKKKGKVSIEGWRVKKNGSMFWGSMTLTALKDADNNVTGFSKITRDITQRKIANDKLKLSAKELEEKNVELEKINKELESFSYVASHDLQEPLRKIQAFSNLIVEREKKNFSDTTLSYFNKMNMAAARMQQLINDLLEFSRLSTSVEFKEVDLNILLAEVISNLKISIDEADAVVKAGKLPKTAVIPFQFKQMLQNLISNSIKYRMEGRRPFIQISHRIVKGESLKEFGVIKTIRYLKISIKDNGIGFDQKYASRIFELFQRLHGKDEYKGTGIGLAICKKIVQNHNGFINAFGVLGEGSTFDLYIPEKILE